MIKEINIMDIPTSRIYRLIRQKGGCLKDIERFIDEEMNCAEVIMDPDELPESVFASYWKCVSKVNMNVACIKRHNQVFLVRKDLLEGLK